MAPDTSNRENSAAQRPPGSLPEVALVDDSRALYFAWKVHLREQAVLHWFASPEQFWKASDADSALLDRLCVVIIDHRFPGSREDGISFASSLSKRAPRLRRVLSSCGFFSQLELSNFHSFIGKSPVSLQNLLAP
jgi:hypothetical protein